MAIRLLKPDGSLLEPRNSCLLVIVVRKVSERKRQDFTKMAEQYRTQTGEARQILNVQDRQATFDK